MDDKDFLGYFTQLGNSNTDKIKIASSNIVSTLLALDSKVVRKVSMDAVETKEKERAEKSLKKKYMTGDLGADMAPDVNYSIKRCVRGLASENHAVKRGFFLASVQVLSRFNGNIDFSKYINFIEEETKTSEGMKNPEIHCILMGRMMCLSAIAESSWTHKT